jgi:hypothetical protein
MPNYNGFAPSLYIGSSDCTRVPGTEPTGPTVKTAVFPRDPIDPELDLSCLARGTHRPHAPPKPYFQYPVLQVGHELVRTFRRHCKQTELLDVIQSQQWPYIVIDPLGARSPLDPENGLSDLVYQLNTHQQSRLQLHFWLVGGGVRWEVCDEADIVALHARNSRGQPNPIKRAA